MVTAQFTPGTIDQAKAKANAARDSLKDGSVPMRQASIYLDRWVQKNFKGEGSNVGGWAAFAYGGRLTTKSKATAKNSGRWVNFTAKLLQDTGHLRISFLPFATQTNAGIGSDLPYSKYHQDGGKNLPQRRMLPEKNEVMADLTQILDNWVRMQIQKANT